MNGCAGFSQPQARFGPTLRLLCLLALGLGIGCPGFALAKPGLLQGYVHSTTHGQEQQPKGAYYLLILADSAEAEAALGARLQRRLGALLRRVGYAKRARQMQQA